MLNVLWSDLQRGLSTNKLFLDYRQTKQKNPEKLYQTTFIRTIFESKRGIVVYELNFFGKCLLKIRDQIAEFEGM